MFTTVIQNRITNSILARVSEENLKLTVKLGIYPREIEEFLYTHEAIADVQVIGVPSEKYGEEVMAWVKIKSGHSLSAEELTDFCTNRIAYYKIPAHWKFVEGFPMTVTGKVRKVEMRETSISELGLQEIAKIRTS